jgi:hypothetical protein
MKKPPRVALIGAGKFSDSPITRMRFVEAQLGPVKAPSLRVASRIANSLRSGHPVATYEEFENCDLILISVPDPLLATMIGELATGLSTWREKVVVACSVHAGCEQLASLADCGATTGTLAMIPGYEDRWLLLEGEKAVERKIRPLLADLRVTAIGAFQKRHYLKALAGLGQQFLPCLKLAMDELKTSGIGGTEASEIVERQVARTMRSYFRSGLSTARGTPT